MRERDKAEETSRAHRPSPLAAPHLALLFLPCSHGASHSHSLSDPDPRAGGSAGLAHRREPEGLRHRPRAGARHRGALGHRGGQPRRQARGAMPAGRAFEKKKKKKAPSSLPTTHTLVDLRETPPCHPPTCTPHVHPPLPLSSGGAGRQGELAGLVVALVFHQLAEGLGLGAAISAARPPRAKALGMALFFAATTPAGIVGGIALSLAYPRGTPGAALLRGSCNGLSAGVLLYLALVTLIAEDFGSPELARRDRKGLRGQMLAALLCGAGAMTLLAIWG